MEKPLQRQHPRITRVGRGRRAGETNDSRGVLPLRFDEGLRRFRARLPDVGPVYAARIESQSYLPAWRPEQDYTGTVLGAPRRRWSPARSPIHEIDYAVWLYGRPQEVMCRLTSLGQLGIGAETTADLLWTAPSGADRFHQARLSGTERRGEG